MDSELLKEMVSNWDGGMKAFAKEAGIPYTTLFTSLESDSRLERMPIENFKKVAKVLGMTIDELNEKVEYAVVELEGE